jgi:hypothetical protein
MERLNYFSPYQSKGAWHEDQLTRAFLVVVRMVPLALVSLLDLIREQQAIRGSESRIPTSSEMLTREVEIQTQKNSIPQTTGRLVSVVMTDEEWKPQHDVVPSDRGARYDGILAFDPEWIIVIENKPSSRDIWEGQVCPNLPESHDIQIDKIAVVLRWRSIIERLSALMSANVFHGAEMMIVDDFLQFVDEEFPYLNPYNTFGQCKNLELVLQRRCRNILETVAPGRVEWQPKWGTSYILLNHPAPAKMCALYPRMAEGGGIGQIEAAIYPGDTMAQARALYAHLRGDNASRLLALRDRGWRIEPNFHFGFIRSGFGRVANAKLSLEEYIRYWTDHPIQQASLAEQTFEAVLQGLTKAGMIGESDIDKIISALPSATARNVNIIPGIEMVFAWPLSKAVEIDKRGQMAEEFKRTMNEALVACGCEPFGLVRPD